LHPHVERGEGVGVDWDGGLVSSFADGRTAIADITQRYSILDDWL